LHGSTESAIPENPLVGPNISSLFAIQAQLIGDFVQKYPKFRCHGNKGQFRNILHGSVELAAPQNPGWCKNFACSSTGYKVMAAEM